MSLEAGNPAPPWPCFRHEYGGESNPALPQPCFKHDRRVYLFDIPSESCQCLKWNVIASSCLWRMHYYIIYGQTPSALRRDALMLSLTFTKKPVV